MKQIFSPVLFLGFLVTVLVSCQAKTQNSPEVVVKKSTVDTVQIPDFDKKAALLNDYFKKLRSNGRFNGAILVAQSGKVIYRNYSGYLYKNKKSNDTLNFNSRFQIGSASKSFTAASIMLLKDRGLIKYDDDVKTYIQEFPYAGITVRMLLSHRSGLSNYIYFTEEYTDRNTLISNEDVMKLMVTHKPESYYSPNEGFHYCNTNYMLLALIVERVSKLPFKTFVKNEIFTPLHMDSSFVYDPFSKDTLFNVATGYHYQWNEALHVYQDGVTGDKNVYTTINDLLKWDQSFYSASILKKETIEEALQPSSKERKGQRNYGFGFRLLKVDSTNYISYHGGWWRGFNALFMRDPKNKFTIIIFSNVRTNSALAYSEILDILEPTRQKADVSIEEQANSKD